MSRDKGFPVKNGKLCEIEIIDDPTLKGFGRQVTEGFFKTVFWLFWIYLMLPFLCLILWFIGIKIFYIKVILASGYKELFFLIKKAGLITLVFAVIFLTWGYYNYLWFGRRNRRRFSPAATVEDVAHTFQLHPEEVVNLHQARIITFLFDEEEIEPKMLTYYYLAEDEHRAGNK